MAKTKIPSEGALFSTPAVNETKVSDGGASQFTVTTLTKNIREVLESKFVDVTVEGEISNFVFHRSGHRYWALNDPNAQISCVFWKTRQLSYQIGDGQKVICRGRLTVYPPRGNYQLDVFQVRPVGVGALQAAFEALFKKLESEGIFDESRKRPIPRFPKKIGIVTSPTGAALYDILNVLRRRYPIAQVLLRPVAVQGVGVELEIARAIHEFGLLPIDEQPDVLIVGRGGGSLEDLWAFNEEAVARAIFASKIPVISGVGHEVDVTLADYAADLRAPTPTAAAELATSDRNELLSSIRSTASVMNYLTRNRMSDLKNEFRANYSVVELQGILAKTLAQKEDTIQLGVKQMQSSFSHFLEISTARTENYRSTLAALNPYAVLDRGYSIIQDQGGKLISKVAEIPTGSEMKIIFSDGTIGAKRTA
ncbi:MAG: exodeoxyribonuclease VII large subunit [bacterium]